MDEGYLPDYLNSGKSKIEAFRLKKKRNWIDLCNISFIFISLF